MHKQMIQTLRKSSYGGSHKYAGAPRLSLRNFNSQSTCVNNSTVLTPVQPKIQALKVLEFVPFCANKYAKEKNRTVFTKFYGELFVIISNI